MLNVPGINHIIRHEYDIRKFTYVPSVFGERRLNFKVAEHVQVRDTEHDWVAAIEALADEERKQGNSVLIFFKNEKMLKMFPQYRDYNCLTESTGKKVRNAYV